MFPVAIDGTAFNLPESITRRNFVRYAAPVARSTAESKLTLPDHATAGLLKDLTEALSRDLNARLFPRQAGRKLKIFISYARADGAAVPKAMRDYIQGQTQCEAFFDENDIGFGSKYETVLSESAGDQSRALIVVAGDHYADRPICRWEIRKFTNPTSVLLSDAPDLKRHLHIFHPVMVLSTMSGQYITRVVPELAQAPTLRWERGREMLVFSMLMRAVLLGARNVLAARQVGPNLSAGIVLNRLPGPVALQRLLDEQSHVAVGEDNFPHVHYPGNGLPLMELRLLETTFKNIRLTAFRDVDRHLPNSLKSAQQNGLRPLHEKVIGISYGFSEKLNSLGYLPQHLEETLIYLLRPLLRLGADIMYGGNLPKSEKFASSSVRNMNLTLMDLVNDELSIAGIDGVQEGSSKDVCTFRSRLFNPIAWPHTKEVTAEDEAAWINTCTVIRVLPHHAGLEGEEPQEGSPQYLAWKGIMFSRSREMTATGIDCPIPGDSARKVVPAAAVFIGGKLSGFGGCMPGIMEEFYWALKHRLPVFLLGGFGGAAAVIADAVCSSSNMMPDAFRTSHYSHDSLYAAQLQGYDELRISRNQHPQAKLNWLWKALVQARQRGFTRVCRNGLTEKDNKALMTTVDTLEAVHLIWKGLARLIEADERAKRKRSPRRGPVR